MTEKIGKEKMFYNAVAIALQGDPSGVRTLQAQVKKQYGELFGKPSWQMAWEISASGKTDLPNPERAWEELERAGVRLILHQEECYPPLLREIPHPPAGIYIRGELPQEITERDEKHHAPTIAIVGTRRATVEGRATTKKFAQKLADAGCVIISGLALGIDAAAHEGCLESPNGKTVAILACGLDNYYPKENEWLGKKILERGGAIISEYPLGEPPYGYRFLERNQIVCGLSKGVLVVECPKRSGSQATANYALQQNRDLFVIPGSITHQNFFGSHQLIRQGAELVTAPEEILEAYGLVEKEKAMRETSAATLEEKQVLHALRDAGTALEVDKIIEMAKLEPRVVNRTLSFLLIKHLIKETETGYIIQ